MHGHPRIYIHTHKETWSSTTHHRPIENYSHHTYIHRTTNCTTRLVARWRHWIRTQVWSKPEIHINQSLSEKSDLCAIGYAFEESWSAILFSTYIHDFHFRSRDLITSHPVYVYGGWLVDIHIRLTFSIGDRFMKITCIDDVTSGWISPAGTGSRGIRIQNGGPWLLKSLTNWTPMILLCIN